MDGEKRIYVYDVRSLDSFYTYVHLDKSGNIHPFAFKHHYSKIGSVDLYEDGTAKYCGVTCKWKFV